MRTTQLQFLDFLGQANTQFAIPFYQRAYSWTTSQCEELFEDIMHAGRGNSSHFMSMVLFMESDETGTVSTDNAQDPAVRSLDIIDGQQRIATMSILLLAFEAHLRKTGTTVGLAPIAETGAPTPVEGESANKPLTTTAEGAFDADRLHRTFLALDAHGQTRPRVSLIGIDRDTLDALVMGTSLPERTAPRVMENFTYFCNRMDEDDFDAKTFWLGMRNLLAIAAEIDERDKAQSIFESLNTKGIPLTAADLIRNYLLVAETRAEQQRLYREYWQPMEIMFEDDLNSSGSLKLNTGLRMWLSIRSRKMVIGNRGRTYYYFKLFMEQEYDGTVEDLLDEMRGFCYLWAENYKCNEGRSHCSQFAWAKKGNAQTLAPSAVTGSTTTFQAEGNGGVRKRPPLKRPLPGVNGFLPGWGHQGGF